MAEPCDCHEPAVFGHRCPAWTPRPKPEPPVPDPWLTSDRMLDARLRWLATSTSMAR